ncbi:Peptidase m24 [Globisporangium polare]
MDPSDWRVYEWHARDLLDSGVCQVDALRCRRVWELALTFSPNTTLKAKLFRSQSLFALDKANDACQMLDTLVPQYPQSLPLANNVGICRVYSGMLSEARALFHRAAYKLPTYEGAREIAVRNLENFDKWLAKHQETHSDRAMTPEESNTFFGTVMW